MTEYTCSNCAYFNPPMHQGDIACGLNPGFAWAGADANECMDFEWTGTKLEGTRIALPETGEQVVAESDGGTHSRRRIAHVVVTPIVEGVWRAPEVDYGGAYGVLWQAYADSYSPEEEARVNSLHLEVVGNDWTVTLRGDRLSFDTSWDFVPSFAGIRAIIRAMIQLVHEAQLPVVRFEPTYGTEVYLGARYGLVQAPWSANRGGQVWEAFAPYMPVARSRRGRSEYLTLRPGEAAMSPAELANMLRVAGGRYCELEQVDAQEWQVENFISSFHAIEAAVRDAGWVIV